MRNFYGPDGAPDECTSIYRDLRKDPKFEIDRVVINYPAVVVMWKDGTKTIVKVQNDEAFDTEKGLAMAFMKKALGNKGNYYEVVKRYAGK